MGRDRGWWATKKGAEPDRPAGEVEQSVLAKGTIYYGHDQGYCRR